MPHPRSRACQRQASCCSNKVARQLAPMAYHLMINVMEAPFGGSPQLAFRRAVIAAFDSLRPISRLHAAGLKLARTRPCESLLGRHMQEQIEIDTNPLVRCGMAASSIETAFHMHRLYEASASIAIRTVSEALPSGKARIVQRIVPSDMIDPNICRDAHLAALDTICRSIARHSAAGPPEVGLKLSWVAKRLGLERSAAFDAALALEEDPTLKVSELAKRLGWQVRTLERWLNREGLTAMAMKRGAMIIHATSLLPGELSLTEVAHAAGYSDLAHMSRGFMKSCSLTPTQLRASVRRRVKTPSPPIARG